MKIDGVPDDVTVMLQIGPAINGTALRDATGLVDFNDFLNQIEYANAEYTRGEHNPACDALEAAQQRAKDLENRLRLRR